MDGEPPEEYVTPSLVWTSGGVFMSWRKPNAVHPIDDPVGCIEACCTVRLKGVCVEPERARGAVCEFCKGRADETGAKAWQFGDTRGTWWCCGPCADEMARKMLEAMRGMFRRD